MAELLLGKPVASTILEWSRKQSDGLRAHGIQPTLAIVRVGRREDDLAYERGALKRAKAAGVAVQQYALPADAGEQEVLFAIQEVNARRDIHGCLLLRPLPAGIDDGSICRALLPQKDIDGITDVSRAGVYAAMDLGYPPCTAQACMEILHHYGMPVAGRRAVVVGRSLVVGKPAALLLLQEHATVTICHTRTKALPDLCRGAEILVVAMGRANALGAEALSPDQIVLDVGIHDAGDGTLCGDVRFEEASQIVKAVTPVPGGVGAVTTAVLMKHVVLAALHGAGEEKS